MPGAVNLPGRYGAEPCLRGQAKTDGIEFCEIRAAEPRGRLPPP